MAASTSLDIQRADAHGFRQDVMALVRELAPTIMRYPGGNFVSGYNWEDGVGPVGKAPASAGLRLVVDRTEYASARTSSSTGAGMANIEPMLAVNLGTRGPAERRRIHRVLQSSRRHGTLRSSRRTRLREAARREVLVPGQRDGRPWQTCAKTADEYGRIAQEAAKIMRWVDPSIELAACGSSGRNMPTFGAWEETVLEHCFDHVDWISLHTYLNNYADDTPAFLASART